MAGDFFADFSGTNSMRQSGGLKFKMASLATDTEIMNCAFESAKKIISDDPDLIKPENALLSEIVSKYMVADFSTIS